MVKAAEAVVSLRHTGPNYVLFGTQEHVHTSGPLLDSNAMGCACVLCTCAPTLSLARNFTVLETALPFSFPFPPFSPHSQVDLLDKVPRCRDQAEREVWPVRTVTGLL